MADNQSKPALHSGAGLSFSQDWVILVISVNLKTRSRPLPRSRLWAFLFICSSHYVNLQSVYLYRSPRLKSDVTCPGSKWRAFRSNLSISVSLWLTVARLFRAITYDGHNLGQIIYNVTYNNTLIYDILSDIWYIIYYLIYNILPDSLLVTSLCFFCLLLVSQIVSIVVENLPISWWAW